MHTLYAHRVHTGTSVLLTSLLKVLFEQKRKLLNELLVTLQLTRCIFRYCLGTQYHFPHGSTPVDGYPPHW